MCRMNYQNIDEFYTPCCDCPDYLTVCQPIIYEGNVNGECDFTYCEACPIYEDCQTPLI